MVIAYSSTKNLENGKSWMLAYANIEVSYGAVELGLRFTKCANGSPCMVPAHGVRVTTTQRDVRGVEISHQWTGGPWVVNENGYLVMGVFLSENAQLPHKFHLAFVHCCCKQALLWILTLKNDCRCETPAPLQCRQI